MGYTVQRHGIMMYLFWAQKYRKTLVEVSNLDTIFMLRLHWTTFSLRPYHVLNIQERGEDGVKMKQFRISKFPLRPYYVPATFLLRPHHVLLRPSRFHYVLNTRSPSSSRFHHVLATSSQRPNSSYHARTTFPVRSNSKYINQSCIKSQISCETA